MNGKSHTDTRYKHKELLLQRRKRLLAPHAPETCASASMQAQTRTPTGTLQGSGNPALKLPACHRPRCCRRRGAVSVVRAGPEERQRGEPTEDTSPALKAVWYGAELFGKIVGKQNASQAPQASQKKMTFQEIVDSIRADYAENYFVSGAGEMAAYASDCVFADPFVSFPGTARFKQNVGNLGGQMRDIKLKVYDFSIEGEDKVHTKWRFSCVLNLPWKPLLAAAGGTTHVIDRERGLIVEHIERWDVEPSKVVAQLFKPSNPMPSSNLETFLLSQSENDGKGMWAAASPFVIRLSLALAVASSVGAKLLTGEVNVQLLVPSMAALAAGSITEVLKFARGMQGGDTGTGGRF